MGEGQGDVEMRLSTERLFNENLRVLVSESKGIYTDGNNAGSMNLKILHSVLVLFILLIVITSGCIVPTKDSKTTPTPTAGTDYLVKGTGSSSNGGTSTAQSQGTPQAADTKPTQTPLPQDTRFLTPVNPSSTLNYVTPDYRNISTMPEPTETPIKYMEIYNNFLPLKDYVVAYAYDLTNPPLIISFDIKPRLLDRTIWYENPSGSRGDIVTQTKQISPNAWFEVKVMDKATGNVVLDDGFGRTLGSDLVKNVTVRSAGNYQIEMSGNEVNVTVKMYIPNTT
jgi:hypothetical protein